MCGRGGGWAGEYVGEMGDSVYRFPINHRKWYWSGRAKECLNKEAKPDNIVVEFS